MRELRNQGGAVLARVDRGESLIVTRDAMPVAQLSPIRKPSLPAGELVSRRRSLPHVDVRQLRRDIDTVIDSTV